MKDHHSRKQALVVLFYSNADVSYASEKNFKIYRDNSFYFLVNIVK